MNEKSNKTAVEWLVEKLMKGEFINSPDELIEQAKEMEKQQIIDAHLAGQNEAEFDYEQTEIEYYNEIYGK